MQQLPGPGQTPVTVVSRPVFVDAMIFLAEHDDNITDDEKKCDSDQCDFVKDGHETTSI